MSLVAGLQVGIFFSWQDSRILAKKLFWGRILSGKLATLVGFQQVLEFLAYPAVNTHQDMKDIITFLKI